MGRRTILFLVAIVIAALGATLVFLYVRGIEAEAVEGEVKVQVLTATGPILAGETIEEAQDAGKLQLTPVTQTNVVAGALKETSTIKGMMALTDIYPGEQILADRFGSAGADEKITIPDGTMAVSVQLTDPDRVAGFVTPGSSVSVIYTNTDDPDVPAFTRMLLDDVEVIGVGTTSMLSTTKTDAEGAEVVEEVPTTILTLALTQGEAERAIFGSKNGILTLSLLNDKSKPKPGSGVTAKNLFEDIS